MVQGLGFLSKKSWHTKNLKNQEAVWVAEERKRTEQARTKELAQQIQAEREQDELQALTGVTTNRDRGIDWMYQGQSAQSEIAKQDAERQAEEYLLGKPVKATMKQQGVMEEAATAQEGIHKVLKHDDEKEEQPRKVLAEPTVAERNEEFRKRFEDPMFVVALQQREKEHELEKKKQLYERVTGGVAVEVKKNSEKKPSKKRKHKKHRRDEDSDSDSDDRRARKKRHRRSYSSEDSRRRSYRRSGRSQSRSPSPRRERRRSPPRREKDRSPIRHERERSPPRRDRDERYRYPRDHDAPRDRLIDRCEHRSSRMENSDRPDRRNERPGEPKDGYGLRGASISRSNGDDLGPSHELLRNKRKQLEDERRQRREQASQRRFQSVDERARALQEMTQDAHQRAQVVPRPRSSREEEEQVSGRASFLHEMSRQTHGVDGNLSLSERVRQNRNTNQRSHESFL